MTGLENLMYTARLNGIPDKEAKVKALELMKRVGLEDQLKRKPESIPAVWRQRLGLADVLIKNPEIIILDEPTSGIDPAGVQEFIELIRWLSKEEGLTVLFSSHHLDQAQKVCDRVGLFSNGKILALIDMAELKERNRNCLIFITIILRKEAKGMSKVNHPFGLSYIRKYPIMSKLAFSYSDRYHSTYLYGIVIHGAY